MRLRSLLLVSLAALAVSAPPSSSAVPQATQTCNPRGSWVKTAAETSRFAHAINPTTTDIHTAGGALSATFDRGVLTYGVLSLTIIGERAGSTIKEVVDIETVAPYHEIGRAHV